MTIYSHTLRARYVHTGESYRYFRFTSGSGDSRVLMHERGLPMPIQKQSVLFFLILLSLLAPRALRAQFQQPSQEELKMTSDPKAPGADAVYLYREEIDEGHNHSRSYYVRIKVLTERGRELATVHVYQETIHYNNAIGFREKDVFKVTDIKGRTIHPDGTVVELDAKTKELHPAEDKQALQKTVSADASIVLRINNEKVDDVVFTLPSVEVGSILEYRYVIRNDEHYYNDVVPAWQIQQPYFVHRAHYEFTPWNLNGIGASIIYQSLFVGGKQRTTLNPSLLYSAVGVPADSIKQIMNARYQMDSIDRKARDFVLDLTDIPAAPQEDWMPPQNTVNMRVEFYQTYASSGKEFWDSETKYWAGEMSQFIHPNKTMRDAAASLTMSAASDEEKARQIYDAVMKLDNTDFSRALPEDERRQRNLRAIRGAEDVWKQKSGKGDELALLYVALARAAGLTAWPMKVVNRDRALFNYYYASTRQMDDYIAIVEVGGQDVYVDPGQAMCPFGQLHWKHSMASGFRLTDKGAVLASTPAPVYANAMTRRLGDLTLSADASVSGGIRLEITGPDALEWRQAALLNGEDQTKKRFAEMLRGLTPEGITVELTALNGLDTPTKTLTATASVSGQLGSKASKRVVLPGQFFAARTQEPFRSTAKRETAIDVHYPAEVHDDATYHLPGGMTAQSLPQGGNISWPNHAIYKTAASTEGGTVNVSRALVYSFTLLDAKVYPDLHDFYQKVAVSDTQPLVLARAAE